MKKSWLVSKKKLRLSSQWTTIEFVAKSREFYLNSIKLYLGKSVVYYKGDLYISDLDYGKTLSPLLLVQNNRPISSLRHIVIDPGHGGRDPGAQNTALRLKEKSLALDLAKRLQKRLSDKGFKVTLTRTKDVFLELKKRSDVANRVKADLFISLHYNSTSNKKVSGVETYAFTPLNQPSTNRSRLHSSDKVLYSGNKNDDWNVLLAYEVQKELVVTTKMKDRGIKRARFGVLKNLRCPGILVECGFLSSTTEAKNIGWNLFRSKLADSITSGILHYEKRLKRGHSK